MRTGLHKDRLRRLVHFARDAMVAGAVLALRKPALRVLANVLERLGLSPGADGAGSKERAAEAQEAGASMRVNGPPQVDARREAQIAESPEQPYPGARTAELAAEAAAQLRHVALTVPPPEHDVALERGRAAAAVPVSVPVSGESAEIPWGYGKDRVTAAAIDPDRLYVYWEVTDDAIARARAELGSTGADAWLNLRVYDTTGLLFDGTNAHHYFDHGLGRSERQWFFDVRRPTSTAFVEIGLRALEGAFARIARSGRVDFPRAEPAPWTEPEWMTVVAATGDALPAGRGMPTSRSAAPPPGPYPQEHGDAVFTTVPQPFTPIPLWVIRDPVSGHEAWVRELTEFGWERVEWHEVHGEHWVELLGRVEWEGPRSVSTWEAGPFSYPVEVRPPTSEEWQGHSVAYQVGGMTRMVHGPWQVVIKNLGAHVSRSVLGRWQIYRSWVAEGGREVSAGAAARPAPRPAGASEGLVAGASERAWLRGSEARLGGASELWRMGASELRFRGASEQLLAGASERIARGASEQRQKGASEWLVRGGSEQILRGASEQLRRGASERLLGGASERAGASERRLGASEERLGGSEGRLGASERRLGADEGRPAGPPPAAGRYPKPE